MDLPALYALLLTIPLTADVPDTIIKWQQRHADVTSVCGAVLAVHYDTVFLEQSEGKGRFARHGSDHAVWEVSNNPDPAHPLRESHGGTHRRVPLRNEHWRRSAGRLWDIDDEARNVWIVDLPRRTAVRHEDPLPGVLLSIVSPPPSLLLTPTQFLPGCPQKAVTLDWDFTVVKETEKLTAITATPKPNSSMQGWFSHCDLLFLGDPITLAAVRVTDPAHTRETVYYFSHIDFAPAVTPESDLEGYEIRHIPSAAARAESSSPADGP